MKHAFKPFEGTDRIRFGSPREAVRQILGNDYREFTRNKFSTNSEDYYQESGLFVGYSVENVCEVLVFSNAATLYYGDDDLLAIKYSALRKKYDAFSTNKEEEAAIGITYHDLGFAVMQVWGKNQVESVTIFTETYYH